MNLVGMQNRAGELMKEVETLLENSKKIRHDQAKWKLAFEKAQQDLADLQAVLYVDFTNSDEVEWDHPNPIMDSDGGKMPEFEAQYQTMLMNTLIQGNEDYILLLVDSDKAKKEFYSAERDERSIMEQIGIKKSQMGLIAALLRLASEE